MKYLKQTILLFTLFFIVLIVIPRQSLAAPPNGSIVRAEGSSVIYLVEEGRKRWVESSQAFQAQGFRWENVLVVPASEIENMPLGLNVGIYSNVILHGESSYLPDLTPFAADNFLITELNGRKVLRFRFTFWNMGARALEVRNGPPIDPAFPDTNNVYQRIVKDGGQFRDRLVNDFIWHPAHNHFHYEDFVDFILEPVDENLSMPSITRSKESQCFWDTIPVNLTLPSAPGGRVYANCDTTTRHGISVGWADVYERTLADQYLDIHNIPAGNYKLTVTINADGRILEQRADNNKSVVILYIDPAAQIVQQVAAGVSFPGASFTFPNNMLIRPDASNEIYIVHNNKKRQLRGNDVISAYGYSENDAIKIPQEVLNAIPYNNLVRGPDGIKVYALNDDGYKRHIANPATFESYGLSWQDIADINQEELSVYEDSSFVRVADSSQLYYQYEHAVWPLASSAATESTFPWSRLQIINSFDFSNYVVGPQLTSIPQSPPSLPTQQAINDTDIPLTLPAGYRISYFTHMQVGPVRFMAISPDGILFVTRPNNTGLYSGNNAGGAVLALPDRNNDGMADEAIPVISGLTDYPHGLAFYNNYLYLAEQSTVSRYLYLGDGKIGSREVVIQGLPSDGGHLSRTITFSPDGKMYVSIGSSCNLCEETDNRRATIMEFNPDGTGGRIFADGIRNAVGIIFRPGTSQLWVTENGRDHLGDDLPPDEINIVEFGKHYGWPYCYGNKIPDPGMNNPGFCSTTTGSVHDMQAHSAPIGLRFVQSEQFSQWDGDLLVAYQGSWNRTIPTGYKVVRLKVEGDNIVGEEDFIYGWLQGFTKLGSPADLIFGPDGALYISDDRAHTIYRVEKI